MAEEKDPDEEAPAKRSKLPMVLGIMLALAGGGGGFYATWSGLILGADAKGGTAVKKEDKAPVPGADMAYIEVEPLVISLYAPADAKHLRFRANLEVPSTAQEDVQKVLPRVVDVLNSYLRAVEPGDLENPAALTRLRAQMLRRVQIVTGPDNVNDLLIMEFVLT